MEGTPSTGTHVRWQTSKRRLQDGTRWNRIQNIIGEGKSRKCPTTHEAWLTDSAVWFWWNQTWRNANKQIRHAICLKINFICMLIRSTHIALFHITRKIILQVNEDAIYIKIHSIFTQLWFLSECHQISYVHLEKLNSALTARQCNATYANNLIENLLIKRHNVFKT